MIYLVEEKHNSLGMRFKTPKGVILTDSLKEAREKIKTMHNNNNKNLTLRKIRQL